VSNIKTCVCGRTFEAVDRMHKYHSPDCRRAKQPLVYCFVCPDGRRYVGSAADGYYRGNGRIGRTNKRLLEAFKQYPESTWTYVVLERLPLGCSERELRAAEQHYINVLETWKPEFGFNVALPDADGFIGGLSREYLARLPRGLGPPISRRRKAKGRAA
jgi:hypothetical protein